MRTSGIDFLLDPRPVTRRDQWPCRGNSHLAISVPRTGQTILPMQAMKLLASSGVMAAAGAMISLMLTFAVSPPFTLLPPRLVAVDVNDNIISQQTVGAATTDTFGVSSESTDEIPSMPIQPRQGFDGLSGDKQMLPMPQEALQGRRGVTRSRA